MQSLPNEIIEQIVSYISKITDKRQFTQTCKICNTITKPIIHNQESTIEIKHFKYSKEYCPEKFTLELCNDSYFDKIEKYLPVKNNGVIVKALTIYGQIELLKKAIKYYGYSLFTEIKDADFIEDEEYQYDDPYHDNSCDHAIISGNIKMLKFVRLYGCKWNYRTFYFAVRCDNIEIVKFLDEHGCEIDLYITCYGAAHNGNIIMLEWLIEKGCTFDDETTYDAACKGHFEIVKLLKEKYNCELSDCIPVFAIKFGRLDILQWSIENGCVFDESHGYYEAAITNNFDIIKWMQEMGYVLDSDTCTGAIIGGHLELLKYLKDYGCEYDSSDLACNLASSYGHLHILKWTRENGYQWSKETLRTADTRNQPEIAKYLRENGCPEYDIN